MLGSVNKFLGVLTPVLLLCSGVFFLFRLKFFFVQHPIRCARLLSKREESGGVSPARALSLALAGTLGVGNIVGVASCIKLGGYGAVFWMWVSALVAMVLKFSEIVLALSYRVRGDDGEYHGGAYFYIRGFLEKHGLRRLGGALGGVFAIFCILNSVSMGGIVQANAVSAAFGGEFGLPLPLVSAVIAVCALFIIMGNSQKISAFTEKIVTFMSVGFVAVSLAAIFLSYESILPSLRLIFSSAFNAKSAGFGILGFLISPSFRLGCMRGLMSNEAGCGSSPTAHASSSTTDPVKQGLLGIVEVFVDTILLCTLTALVIIISGEGALGFENPMHITLYAFKSLLGDWSGGFVCFSVLFFGFATIVAQAHYGREALRFLRRSPVGGRVFVLAYAACVFLGGVCSPALAWDIADLALGVMTVINVVMLCVMSGEVFFLCHFLPPAAKSDQKTPLYSYVTFWQQRKK